MRALWQRFIVFILVWFRWRTTIAAPAALLPPNDYEPLLQPDIDPVPLAVRYVLPRRKAKWVTPKGEHAVVKPEPERQAATPKPKTAPKAKPQTATVIADPEEFGQYYFRDQILDQLDNYFYYLKRMKIGDKDSYDLLRQVGIQMLPSSATLAHDQLLGSASDAALSGWWLTHRPGFGAVAYGFDALAKEDASWVVQERAAPAPDDVIELADYRRKFGHVHRPVLFTRGSQPFDRKIADHPSVVWHPRFLYFTKYTKPPIDIEMMPGGDIYMMTVYWDRSDSMVAKQVRKKHKGGTPQQYGIWIGHGSKEVRVLRSKIYNKVVLRWAKGPKGGKCTEPTVFVNKQWQVPDRYLSWCHGRQIEPQDYLRRLFIEAAELYANASMGSMIRVAVDKGNLTATFGVDIKRTPYFFKDRDVVLNAKGSTARIFHIVRPHVRASGAEVQLHFRGLRDFTWAGYKVSITVPGKDHAPLPEFDVGALNAAPRSLRTLGQEKLGTWLVDHVVKGKPDTILHNRGKQ